MAETFSAPTFEISEALKAWREVLGSEYVLTGAQVEPYLVNCLSLSRSIPAVLRPANEEEIQDIVRIAGRHKTPLFPFSTGHNWGYGTALPAVNDCTLVDLSRMNRILGFDAELGLLRVEPGVTQGQLSEYLIASGFDFFVPTTGAGPTVSILGNALERGFGITPEEDHFGAVRSLRAVLPDASIYQSSLASLGLPMDQSSWKWGIGPYTDGLFSQGNFGIVTAMTIALRRRPEHIEVYVFTLKEDDRFPALVCQCRELLSGLHGIAGGIKLMNRAQYGLTLDTAELGMGLSADFSWIGFGVLHCPKSMISAARDRLRKSLKPFLSQIIFLNHDRVRMFQKLGRWAPGTLGQKIRRQARQAEDILQIVRGEPRSLELRLVYRHVPIPPGGPKDPIKEGVGVIWYAPIIPLKADIISRMVAMIQETLRVYEFPQAISLTTVNERCAMGVIPIIYKRPDDKDNAHKCFSMLWKRGKEAGSFPYRINVAVMEELTQQGDPAFWRFMKGLKSAVDPDGLFSPGRYSPR